MGESPSNQARSGSSGSQEYLFGRFMDYSFEDLYVPGITEIRSYVGTLFPGDFPGDNVAPLMEIRINKLLFPEPGPKLK